MSWGHSPWGLGLWGDALIGLSPPTLYEIAPGILDVEGGTIVTILGADFYPVFVPEVLSGPLGGPYVLEASGYLWDNDFDLTTTRALPGMPAMPAGTYSLRVRTPVGVSNVLQDALSYLPFAEATHQLKARSSFAAKWLAGRRLGA